MSPAESKVSTVTSKNSLKWRGSRQEINGAKVYKKRSISEGLAEEGGSEGAWGGRTNGSQSPELPAEEATVLQCGTLLFQEYLTTRSFI